MLLVELWRTYAAAKEVDLLAAVDPDIKPAAVGHQETCWTNENPAVRVSHTTDSLPLFVCFSSDSAAILSSAF